MDAWGPNPQTQISVSLVGLKYDSEDHNISRNINIICDHVDDKTWLISNVKRSPKGWWCDNIFGTPWKIWTQELELVQKWKIDLVTHLCTFFNWGACHRSSAKACKRIPWSWSIKFMSILSYSSEEFDNSSTLRCCCWVFFFPLLLLLLPSFVREPIWSTGRLCCCRVFFFPLRMPSSFVRERIWSTGTLCCCWFFFFPLLLLPSSFVGEPIWSTGRRLCPFPVAAAASWMEGLLTVLFFFLLTAASFFFFCCSCCCLIKTGDNRPAAGSESKSPLDVELLFASSSSSSSSAKNSLVGAGWSVSSTGAEFTRLLWGELLWSLVVLGSESLELLTSSWHSGDEGMIERRRKLSVHVLLLVLRTVLRASTPPVMNDVFPALATKVCITEDALVLHGLVNSCGLKPAKEEEEQQQSVWNTATTPVMWSLSVSHTSSAGERERDPPPCSSCALHPQQTPQGFSTSIIRSWKQVSRPSFLFSANIQTKFFAFCKFPEQDCFFFCKKTPEQDFLFSANFHSKLFFLVFCKLFPEQVVFFFFLAIFFQSK